MLCKKINVFEFRGEAVQNIEITLENNLRGIENNLRDIEEKKECHFEQRKKWKRQRSIVQKRKLKNNLLLNNEIESILYKPILEGDITLFGPFPKKKINELIDNLDKKDREKLLKLYLDSINNIRGKEAFEKKCWETMARVSLLTD